MSERPATIALWFAVIVLGLNWPAMKGALEYVPPFWMVALRYMLSVPVLALGIALVFRRLPVIVRADLPVIFGVGLLQFVGQMSLVTWALQSVQAGTATILIYSTPVWLMLIDRLFLGHRASLRQVILVGMSALGCTVIVGGSMTSDHTTGLFQIILASILWAVSIRLIGSHRWRGDVIDALFWQCLLAAALTLPIAFVAEGPIDLSVLQFPALWFLVFVGPVATAIGFGLIIFAGRHLPAPTVALTSTAAPIIGFVSSSILLEEPLTAPVLLGGGLMLTALLLAARKPRRAA